MERPTCDTCPYYDCNVLVSVYQAPDYASASYTEAFSNSKFEHGGCRRCHAFMPHKKNYEWCGEHPDFPAYIASLNQEREIHAI